MVVRSAGKLLKRPGAAVQKKPTVQKQRVVLVTDAASINKPFAKVEKGTTDHTICPQISSVGAVITHPEQFSALVNPHVKLGMMLWRYGCFDLSKFRSECSRIRRCKVYNVTNQAEHGVRHLSQAVIQHIICMRAISID